MGLTVGLTVGLFLLGSAIALIVSYVLTRKSLGPQAAQRSVLYAIPWLLVGALLPFLLSFIEPYGFSILLGLYALAVWLWIGSWPLRKKQAGSLLLRVEPSLQTRILFWLGLVLVGVAIAMTLSLLDQFTGVLVTRGSILSGIAKIAFWWTLVLLYLALGQSNLELHEHGLTHLFAWQPWERIMAFGWDDDKPNTLILKAKPRTAISRKYITLSIPPAQVEAVDRLLEDYLLETDLAAEMDGESSGQV